MASANIKPEEDLVENLSTLKIENDINILLLGESGVGKSTFINAIANYCKFRTFKKASEGELSILLPTRFKMFDSRTGVDTEVRIGEENDNNETLQAGASATQNVKSYVFPIINNSARLRLIDTPGIVDTRGIQQDRVNMEAILDYLGNLHELHAICLIFKTNQTRNTAPFIYAINEILSRLEKSATNNLVFAFTNARGHDYNPGGTLECLQEIFGKIEQSANKKIQIPLKNNIFCFDNESFRYLAAVQFGNMEFPDSIKEHNIESWNRSYDSFYKMIKYITQCLKPHHVKHTEAVNTARRIIVQMTKPLAEISQLINDNIYVLERHQQQLSLEYDDLSELKKNLYMPVIDIKTTDLPHPVTVCTTRKCCDVKKVGGLDKLHFREPCHAHCYLTNVERQLVGDEALKGCAAMNCSTGMCNRCTCSYMQHMHVYYYTELIEVKQLDENVNKTVLTKEQMLTKKRDLIAKMQTKITELREEHKVIVRSTARFQHFLQTNAITTINDTYKQYIEYLLERENYMGKYRNEHVVKHLNELLKQYEELRKLLIESEKISQQLGDGKSISAKDIELEKENLFRLKYNGAKLKELFNAQKRAIKAEHNDTIVTASIVGNSTESDNEEQDDDEEDNGNDSDNSQSTTNSDGNRRRRGRSGRGNRGRGRRGNFNDRRGRYGNKFNRDAPPPYQDHYGHTKYPNNGPMSNQAGPGHYPNQGQFNNYQNYPQNNPNQFNQGFPPNQGGFPPNQGGFPNQGQNFYNQNGPQNAPYNAQSPPNPNNPTYKVEVNIPAPYPNQPNNGPQQGAWNGPQGYGPPNAGFGPGPNHGPTNYGQNNYGHNNYGPNYQGPNYDPHNPNNFGPNNCGPNSYGQNNSGPSGQNYGNQSGNYQNRGNNDNYRGGQGRGGIHKPYNKSKFDNQNKQDHKKGNQNQGAKAKQQDNQKGGGNKAANADNNKKKPQGNDQKKGSGNDNKKAAANDNKKGAGNDNKKGPGNDFKKTGGNKNDNNPQNRAPPRASNVHSNPDERNRNQSQRRSDESDAPKELIKEFNKTCRAQ